MRMGAPTENSLLFHGRGTWSFTGVSFVKLHDFGTQTNGRILCYVIENSSHRVEGFYSRTAYPGVEEHGIDSMRNLGVQTWIAIRIGYRDSVYTAPSH